MTDPKQRLSDEAIEAMFAAQTAIIATLIEELENSGALKKNNLFRKIGNLLGGYADNPEIPESVNPIRRLRSILEMKSTPYFGR